PVHDSAVAIIQPRASSARPSATAASTTSIQRRAVSGASFGGCTAIPSAIPEGEQQQRIERRHQVVEHDTEAALQGPLEVPDRWRLDDIEEAEHEERTETIAESGGNEEQHEPERDDFVPYDRPVIGYAEIARRARASPHAERESGNDDHHPAGRCDPSLEHGEREPGPQRADGARRDRK